MTIQNGWEGYERREPRVLLRPLKVTRIAFFFLMSLNTYKRKGNRPGMRLVPKSLLCCQQLSKETHAGSSLPIPQPHIGLDKNGTYIAFHRKVCNPGFREAKRFSKIAQRSWWVAYVTWVNHEFIAWLYHFFSCVHLAKLF